MPGSVESGSVVSGSVESGVGRVGVGRVRVGRVRVGRVRVGRVRVGRVRVGRRRRRLGGLGGDGRQVRTIGSGNERREVGDRHGLRSLDRDRQHLLHGLGETIELAHRVQLVERTPLVAERRSGVGVHRHGHDAPTGSVGKQGHHRQRHEGTVVVLDGQQRVRRDRQRRHRTGLHTDRLAVLRVRQREDADDEHGGRAHHQDDDADEPEQRGATPAFGNRRHGRS